MPPQKKIFLCRCKIHLTYFDYPDACRSVRFLTRPERARSFSRLKHLTWSGVYGFRFSLALPANRLIAKRPGWMTFEMSPSYTRFSLPREDTVSSEMCYIKARLYEKTIHVQTNQGKKCLMSFVLKQVMKGHRRWHKRTLFFTTNVCVCCDCHRWGANGCFHLCLSVWLRYVSFNWKGRDSGIYFDLVIKNSVFSYGHCGKSNRTWP